MSAGKSGFSAWAGTRRHLFGAIQDADLLRIYTRDTGLVVSKPCARQRRKKWGIAQYKNNISFLREWTLAGKEMDAEKILAEKFIPLCLIKAYAKRDQIEQDLQKSYLLLAQEGVPPLVVYSLHLVLCGSRRPSINWSDYHQSGDIDAAKILFESVESADNLTGNIVGAGLSSSAVSSGAESREERSLLSVSSVRRRGPGRPKGSKNKPRTPEQFFVFKVRMRASEAESFTMLGARDFADAVIKTNQLQADGRLCGNLQGIELIGPLLI